MTPSGNENVLDVTYVLSLCTHSVPNIWSLSLINDKEMLTIYSQYASRQAERGTIGKRAVFF
jgi:hypothetical protein